MVLLIVVTVVPTDSNGIEASSLRATLENWPASKPKPKVLYTVPVRPPHVFASVFY